MFTTEMTEREIVNAVRNLFKAHIPESNAWAEPNHMSITAQVFGGLAYSALSEARNGIDSRVMVDTVEGAYLDALAAKPPYNTTRLPARFAEGELSVTFPGVSYVLTGEMLTRSDGEEYTVICDAELDTEGTGVVKIRANTAGAVGNAVFGYPFDDNRGAATVGDDGLSGGFEVECDDELRDRLYSYQPGCQFGSITSIEMTAKAQPGVSDAIVCENMSGIDVYVSTETGHVPTAGEISAIQAALDDPCVRMIGQCVRVRPVAYGALSVSIPNPCPAGLSAVEMSEALTGWIVSNAIQGQGFTGAEIRNALRELFPDLAIDTECLDYPGSPGFIYTSAEVTFV